ncbi:hypothetical protein NE237_026360 [Protea cynaroides]|uniref:Uncharacterized protein n=1 Tax=Protea cynaroides TaxID=273540 RepID=A0A9Q0H4V4_9MAGN|nr:hypothetical protein NE237_026360 [Protea cynaroides]
MADTRLFFVSIFLLFVLTSANPSENPNPNPRLSPAHDELEKHGFPIGLLPTNVLDYDLNQTTGDFTVKLGDHCKITLPPDNYLATYGKKITGKLVKAVRIWSSRLGWSPPSTLPRISMRALLVRVSVHHPNLASIAYVYRSDHAIVL